MKVKIWTVLFFATAGLVLIAPKAVAQDVRISVQDNLGQSLPGVYLAVNGKIKYSTDSVGQCRIPALALTPGDTLTASQLGYGLARTVVANQQAEYEFVLGELPSYTIDEVRVAGDLNKFFRKKVAGARMVDNGTATGRFRVEIKERGSDKTYRVEGTFEAENRLPGNGSQRMLFHGPMTLTAACDTTGIDRPLRYFIRQALADASVSVCGIVHEPSWKYIQKNMGGRRGYIGKQDGAYVFTAVYQTPTPLRLDVSLVNQNLIKVSEADRSIRACGFYYAFDAQDEQDYTYQCNTEFADADEKDKKLQNSLVAKTIDYRVVDNQYERVDVRIEEVVFVPKK